MVKTDFLKPILLSLTLLLCSAGLSAMSTQAQERKHRKGKVADTRANASPLHTELPEVVIRPKKQKYSKKNNPAVDLMEKIRATAERSNPRKEPYYSTDLYERMTIALNNVHQPDSSSRKSGNGLLSIMREYVDTAQFTGKPIINLSVRERRGKEIHSLDPRQSITVTEGLRNEGVDENFSQANTQKVLQDVLRPIDIYSNEIPLMQVRFVSPLSNIASNYYKYFITDTITDGDSRYIELSFVPHNPESFGFNGKMYVSLADTTCFIRRVKMQVPHSINLNFVNNIIVEQEFRRDSLGNRLKSRDDMVVEFQIMPGTPEVMARRLTLHDNPSYEYLDEYERYYTMGGEEYIVDEAWQRDTRFWDEARLQNLSRSEMKLGGMMERLRGNKLYYWGEKVIRRLTFGYFTTSKPSYVDIGPLNTMVSMNSVEGVRMRLGGYTTSNLSPHFFLRGYGAYGTKDHRWKYNAEIEYSFTKKKYHAYEFPLNSIRLTHNYDLDLLGQHYLFTNRDNIFLSLKRKESNLTTYRRLTNLEYNLELRSGLSFTLGLRHERQYATQWVNFVTGDGRSDSFFDQAAAKLTVRYAPGESFYQTQSMRRPINMDCWIFQLTHEFGPKGFLGADFTLHKTELSVQKRIWFSAFGYLDMILKGGKVWSRVEFPALTWANANLSYTIQPESFALMNPMEFATDQYLSWDLTYWLNGLLFNRIPYFSRTKLREVVAFRGYYGSLTKRNNPYLQPELYRFPADCNVSLMGAWPYMEVSVGLDNIFKVLRLDYVWRLTYRDLPGVDRSGLRLALHFTF